MEMDGGIAQDVVEQATEGQTIGEAIDICGGGASLTIVPQVTTTGGGGE